MASASSSSPFFGGIRDEELQKQMKQQQQQQQQQKSSSTVPAPAAASERKRRNQPGNPSKYLKHSNMQNMREKELIQAYLPSLCYWLLLPHVLIPQPFLTSLHILKARIHDDDFKSLDPWNWDLLFLVSPIYGVPQMNSHFHLRFVSFLHIPSLPIDHSLQTQFHLHPQS